MVRVIGEHRDELFLWELWESKLWDDHRSLQIVYNSIEVSFDV